MGRYFAIRIGRAALTIVLVVTFAFVVVRLSGDPALMILGPEAPPEVLAAFRKAWGLDDPIWFQYLDYFGAIAKGVLDLGAGNLTPFAAPVAGNELKTTGAFSYVRHPIYGGLLVAATGLSVATESFQRLLVVFLLYLLLDAKSAYEEKELERIHPAYRAYKQVTPKFFPSFDELDEILD